MPPIKILSIAAGSRGSGYATYAEKHPERVQIVGVAEPREFYRQQMVGKYDIPMAQTFTDWREAASREKFADAVIIATQDAMHTEPAIAFARKGYHILLEKPMAPTEEECIRIAAAAKENGIILAVCHVMRYTRYTQALKQVVDSGVIGDVVTLQHLEPVGYWHQAHSFVRGNWRNEAESSFMLLAKSCHDLDWIRHMMGVTCRSLSSFGSLKHFRKEEKPEGASDSCLDCAVEAACPYSAQKIYLGRLAKGQTGWPTNVLTPDVTEASVMDALRNGPYGRCVYACDNDVVDNQVVSMLFDGGRTASFTMTAFNEAGHRKTHIFGTRGSLYGDGTKITRFDFLSDKTEVIDTSSADPSIQGGHGGGDYGIMHSFVEAVQTGDPSKVLSGADESLETHRMVFAAERARKEHCVVDL
ncbi:MAG: Gfo/Idh/MocA family oxidoreductase [bacterium]|nr:Gfo/Idh/MocA family oxidoreductase [bacterium]